MLRFLLTQSLYPCYEYWIIQQREIQQSAIKWRASNSLDGTYSRVRELGVTLTNFGNAKTKMNVESLINPSLYLVLEF